jgi:hypothetical protein
MAIGAGIRISPRCDNVLNALDLYMAIWDAETESD